MSHDRRALRLSMARKIVLLSLAIGARDSGLLLD